MDHDVPKSGAFFTHFICDSKCMVAKSIELLLYFFLTDLMFNL